MMNLDVRALPRMQAAVLPKGERVFRVSSGDERFTVGIARERRASSHTHPAEMAADAPSLNECAEVIAEMFRRMLGHAEVPSAKCQAPSGEKGPQANLPGESMPAFFERLVEEVYGKEGMANIDLPTPNQEEEDDDDDGEGLLWRALPDVSEREDELGKVDVEAGWEAYRREICETMGPTILPTWDEAPEQLKECFAAGIWAAIEPVAAKGVVQSLREWCELQAGLIGKHWTAILKKGGLL